MNQLNGTPHYTMYFMFRWAFRISDWFAVYEIRLSRLCSNLVCCTLSISIDTLCGKMVCPSIVGIQQLLAASPLSGFSPLSALSRLSSIYPSVSAGIIINTILRQTLWQKLIHNIAAPKLTGTTFTDIYAVLELVWFIFFCWHHMNAIIIITPFICWTAEEFHRIAIALPLFVFLWRLEREKALRQRGKNLLHTILIFFFIQVKFRSMKKSLLIQRIPFFVCEFARACVNNVEKNGNYTKRSALAAGFVFRQYLRF